jgi:hypothetical protein
MYLKTPECNAGKLGSLLGMITIKIHGIDIVS